MAVVINKLIQINMFSKHYQEKAYVLFYVDYAVFFHSVHPSSLDQGLLEVDVENHNLWVTSIKSIQRNNSYCNCLLINIYQVNKHPNVVLISWSSNSRKYCTVYIWEMQLFCKWAVHNNIPHTASGDLPVRLDLLRQICSISFYLLVIWSYIAFWVKPAALWVVLLLFQISLHHQIPLSLVTKLVTLCRLAVNTLLRACGRACARAHTHSYGLYVELPKVGIFYLKDFKR